MRSPGLTRPMAALSVAVLLWTSSACAASAGEWSAQEAAGPAAVPIRAGTPAPASSAMGEAGSVEPALVIKQPPPDAELARGRASWYGPRFHGRRTASGERFDMNELTAAHPSLPFGTRVLVRNIANGREVVVRINDRLPPIRKRIIDLSKAAATSLGFLRAGETPVVLIEH